jgi:hypothetical protein
MIAPSNDAPRDPFWQRAVLAAIPAIATAVIVEIGTTVRAVLDRRAKSKEESQ